MRNWQKKLTYILTLLVIIGAYQYFKSAKVPHPFAETEISFPQKDAVLLRKRKLDDVGSNLVDCLEGIFEDGELVRERVLALDPAWENIHFRKGGVVFRIREFNDDGPNGDVRKLILYKEDEDGFAHIEKIWESGDFERTRQKLLANTEQIHKEMAFIADYKQSNIFLEIVNFQITRLEVNNNNVLGACSQ
jgi:hypothetical protein